MKKIYVNKSDSAVSVIERVINVPDKDITLYIPRDTEFSRLKNNFRLLKREAEQVGKNITIESVEDITLDSAAAVGLKSINPFFGQKTRMVSDIVMRGDIDAPLPPVRKQDIKQPEKPTIKDKEPKKETLFTAREFNDGNSVWSDSDEEKPRNRKLTFILVLVAIVLIAVGVVLYMVLPEATVDLTFTETPYNYTGPLVIDSNVQTASATTTSITIPGEIFSDTENYVLDFTPSGSQHVSQSATGQVDIYNAYSSSPQTLVKTTRFTAPNGDVYRLDNTVTVPGATISAGTLVPSYIQASVTADEPGADYNISTTTRFRIPGFQNTAKYNGFYADSVGPFTGGFVGVMAVPTASDLATAHATAENTLDSVLQNELTLKLPSDIKVLQGSSEISTSSEVISSTPNAQGQYSLTVYGSIKIFGFIESNLLSVLATEVASQSSSNLSLYSYSANYSDAKPNFAKGLMTVSLNLTSEWTQQFDLPGFQSRAEGLNESALRTLIFSLPGIKSANVQFWPFWVMNAPKNTSKINVDVGYAS